ncbi:pseudouridine synthase [Echinicola pacifica]|uniref:Pseudouridine synthase n=1 Tax=Echinicola pacifica TaxID=346377 RepID=A0A918UNC7_9BACT|nr:pseudouridine synthase [Echinicola pacifica]GGZ22531.1 pseudouridine synthase [Echinicola pacifica]
MKNQRRNSRNDQKDFSGKPKEERRDPKSAHSKSRRPDSNFRKGKPEDDSKTRRDSSPSTGFSPLKKFSKSADHDTRRDDSRQGPDNRRPVYKGRGKDQKPVFAFEEQDERSKSKKPTKFKPGKFTKGAYAPREQKPKYNLKNVKAGPGRTEEIRLNKYIANSGICSRRDADKLIENGEIQVNGQVVTELGHRVMISDSVIYRGKTINPEKPVYVLLNKPKDFITTTDDPMNRKTVMHLVEGACEERIFPVGRLDRNTTGLLLFTNDGDLASKLSHPSQKIKKIYQVTLDQPITNVHVEAIQEGLTLEDGLVQVDDIQILSKDRTILGMEIHVGKNRIVRRIFAHLGYDVVQLDRVTYAGLTKKDLSRSNWRYLTEKEVINLKFFK